MVTKGIVTVRLTSVDELLNKNCDIGCIALD